MKKIFFAISLFISTVSFGQSHSQQANLQWINVRDRGVKGDGVTDDRAAIQAIFDTCPLDAVVYFPNGNNSNGYYRINGPLNYIRRFRIVGESKHGAVLFATTGFSGKFLIRNWTDAESSTDVPPSSPSVFAYPDIENMGFAMGGGLTNTSFIGVANYNETCYIGHIIMSPSSDCVRVRGIVITGINGGKIEDITAYGSTSVPCWGSELYIPGIGAGSSAGASLFVDTWVTSQNFHSESPFFIKGLHNGRLTHLNCEANAGNVAGAATIRLVDCYGFSLTESLINRHSATSSQPAIKSTNSSVSGNSVTSPTIQNVEMIGRSNYTGNIIEDSSQSGNAYLISPVTYPVDYIDLYNGHDMDIRDNISPNLSIPKHYDLHAGLINFVGWASSAPTTGIYAVGDKIWNTNPTQNGGLSHWVCTATTPLNSVAYVSSSSNTAAAQTVVVTAPAGIQDNDILFAIVMNSASGTPGTPSYPAGFSDFGVTYGSGNYKFNVGWKRAASESGNYTFNGASGCTNISAAISVYRNCLSTGNPFNVQHSSSDYTTNNTTIRASPGFIPTSSGKVIWAGFAQAAAETITAPAAFTERENPALNNNSRIEISDSSYVFGTNTISNVDGTLGVATAVKRADAFVLFGQGATWKAVADSTSSGGAGVALDASQTYTSGATLTVTNGNNYVYVNPASVQAALTITLPTTWHNSNTLYIVFGGTISSGNPVITSFSVTAGSGQAKVEVVSPTGTFNSGDVIEYKLNGTNDYRIL